MKQLQLESERCRDPAESAVVVDSAGRFARIPVPPGSWCKAEMYPEQAETPRGRSDASR